jgi:hypothetical protein
MNGLAQTGVTRSVLLSLGWVLAATVLYWASFLLDVYWNLAHWRFQIDAIAIALVLCGVAALAAIRLLVKATSDRFTRTTALLVSTVLVIAGTYAFQAEPQTTGLFARDAPSPLVYRAARVLWMSLPLIWVLASFKRAYRFASGPKQTGNSSGAVEQ